MKLFRKGQRIFILLFLCLSVITPILLVSVKLKNVPSSVEKHEFIADLSSLKYRTEALKLSALEQEDGEDLKQPMLNVFKEKALNSGVSYSFSKDINSVESGTITDGANSVRRNGTNEEGKEQVGDTEPERSPRAEEIQTTRLPPAEEINTKKLPPTFGGQGKSVQTTVQHDQNIRSPLQQVTDEKVKEMKDQGESVQTTVQHDQNIRSPLRPVTDEKVKEMKDQVIRAKAYLNFATSTSNTHLIKELKLRIKEEERALGEAKRDSDLSRSALQRMRNMEASLAKAGRIYNDCSAMATKLRAMTENAEEQVRAQKNQVNYLVHLAARTTPKGLHCLSMRLTTEYFSLRHEERELLNQDKVNDPDLYHYAVFSDNVLACAVVVNSTISTAKEPEKIVFHVVTDSLNLPAISMWFLLNRPSKATIHVWSMENFAGLPSSFPKLTRQNARDSRFTSPLNHLRFYLPDIFPQLNAIVLFDHDVVVQKDLTGLWKTEMKGKVIGAVETCQEGEPSFRQMDLFVNFSDPTVAERFDVKACTWAFGINLFNLQEWRKRNLTAVYQKYLQMGAKRQLSVAGSLPMGWITFYNQTVALNKRWQVLGLGDDPEVAQQDIGKAAVIHYDGLMKPWLDIGIRKYKGYWSRHINYDNPYLQQCNIHSSG